MGRHCRRRVAGRKGDCPQNRKQGRVAEPYSDRAARGCRVGGAEIQINGRWGRIEPLDRCRPCRRPRWSHPCKRCKPEAIHELVEGAHCSKSGPAYCVDKAAASAAQAGAGAARFAAFISAFAALRSARKVALVCNRETVAAPMMRPASTSLCQCASQITRLCPKAMPRLNSSLDRSD